MAEPPSILSPEPAILFTAFEPSGDDHASAVIAELRARYPDLVMYAWGGPKMAAAGAQVIERTGEDAVMGVPGIKKISEHRAINGRIRKWLEDHRITVHVPVDSPAANFPVCRLTKAHGAKVVHLVAPQLWAWGSWRARKLRRLTDRVLCLLPFEEAWFKAKDIPAEFVGHPLFDRPVNGEAIAQTLKDIPEGSPRVLLLPGSRPAEIGKNFPLLLDAFVELSRTRPDLRGLIAVTTPQVEGRIRDLTQSRLGKWPERLHLVSGATDAAIAWCDLALVVSGTVKLQVAKQHKPMVIVYKSNPVAYAMVGWWVIDTEFFALPNLIAGKEIVPELIPHFGDHQPIVDAASVLLSDPAKAEAQRSELQRVTAMFQGRNAAESAATAIARECGLDENGQDDLL